MVQGGDWLGGCQLLGNPRGTRPSRPRCEVSADTRNRLAVAPTARSLPATRICRRRRAGGTGAGLGLPTPVSRDASSLGIVGTTPNRSQRQAYPTRQRTTRSPGRAPTHASPPALHRILLRSSPGRGESVGHAEAPSETRLEHRGVDPRPDLGSSPVHRRRALRRYRRLTRSGTAATLRPSGGRATPLRSRLVSIPWRATCLIRAPSARPCFRAGQAQREAIGRSRWPSSRVRR